MTVNLSLLAGAGWQFFDDNGDPLSGGKLFTYAAGTTTPLTTYTSSSGATPHANPIILNAAGRLSGSGEIWLTEGASYKFVLTDANDVLVGTYDNIDGANDFSEIFNSLDPTKGDALVGFRQSNVSGNFPGAVGRTVHQKLQEFISVLDFGAVGDGVTDSTAAFVAAASAAGEGGVVRCPSGVYALSTVNCLPVSFVGNGAGATIFKFNNAVAADGFVFAAPTKLTIQFGAENATIQTVNGHGSNAFNLPKGASLNDLRPMPTFKNLAFRGQNSSGFAQDFSWQWMFNLGDAWGLVIDHVDACGSFRPELNPASQFIDGFMRTNPTQGILTAWVSNITTHNVARFWEIRRKTYLRLSNIDVARSQRGIYDAADRVFEPNPYAYGESHWNSVVINASEIGVDLKYRYATNADGLIIQRAGDAFDFGGDWIGCRFTSSRNCVVNGLSIGAGGTLAANKIGYVLDGCDAISFANATFGTLDVCARVGVTGSAEGATQSHLVANFSLFSNVGTVLDVQNARSFCAMNFAKSSGFNFTTFADYADAASRANTFIVNAPTDNAIEFDDDFFWVNRLAAVNEKRWRWNTASGNLNLSTQEDDLTPGNNCILITRTGVVVDSLELRSSQIFANGSLQIPDVTSGLAPPTVSGRAQIYVDPADGDLKVKFGDGTVKTIATDT